MPPARSAALACELGLDWRAVRGIGVMGARGRAGRHLLEESREPMAEAIWHHVEEEATKQHPQDMNLARDNFPELRDAVRQLCTQFDSAVLAEGRRAARYPEAFVEALTKAGWMSALIPEDTVAPAFRSPKRP
jgi:alkylation response protein AidB-like acyl-CoA dehydrogenase